jgi:hypothetical protein
VIICDACNTGFETMKMLRRHQDAAGHPASWDKGKFSGITVGPEHLGGNRG